MRDILDIRDIPEGIAFINRIPYCDLIGDTTVDPVKDIFYK